MGVLERGTAWSRTHPLVIDIAVAVVLGPLAVWTTVMLFWERSEAHQVGSVATHALWAACVTAAVAAAHVAIAGRRAWPLASFGVVAAATAVQTVTSIWLVLPSALLMLPSLYAYCAYGRKPAPMVSLAVSVLGAVVCTVAGWAWWGRPMEAAAILEHLLRLVPLLVAAWSLGMFRRVRVAYVAALEERAIRAEADREQRARRAVVEERARIAREMHDLVAHALSVVISQAQGGRYSARADPEQAVVVLSTIVDTGRQALGDMRGLLEVLRTGEPDAAEYFPQPTLADLPDLLERVRKAGLRVEHDQRGTPGRLSPAAELAVFRLVQEALTNTIKHGGTIEQERSRVRAEVQFDWSTDVLEVTVTDDGSGQGTTGEGLGLVGMRERLAVVGGSVITEPTEAGGFQVRATVPAGTS